jgi:hypothetical protein
MLPRNLLPPSSGYTYLYSDEARRFLQTVGTYLPHYMASHPKDHKLPPHRLINDAFSIASNDGITDEVEGIWKEVVMA